MIVLPPGVETGPLHHKESPKPAKIGVGMRDGLFDAMVREAIDEVNKCGWRNANGNAVTLASYGFICDKVEKKVDRLTRPAWAVGISVIAATIWWIVKSLIGL